MQHVLSQVHVLEGFQEQDVCRTSIIHQNLPDDPSNYVYFNEHSVAVVRGLQSEIFFGECYRHFGSFWSCSWTIVDDCVHGSEIVVSLPFGFELHS
jgi:hypothetical protein